MAMSSKHLFENALVALGIGFIAAGSLHVVFGLGADQMLGADVSTQSRADAGLDSQNRFYGAAFTLYGVLLIVIAKDIQRFASILRCVLWVFWLAGAARFISVALYGWPPIPIGALLVVELVLPPTLLLWFTRIVREGREETDDT